MQSASPAAVVGRMRHVSTEHVGFSLPTLSYYYLLVGTSEGGSSTDSSRTQEVGSEGLGSQELGS